MTGSYATAKGNQAAGNEEVAKHPSSPRMPTAAPLLNTRMQPTAHGKRADTSHCSTR